MAPVKDTSASSATGAGGAGAGGGAASTASGAGSTVPGGAASAKGARGAEGASDCSCSEARAHLEVFLDQECSRDLSERLAQHVATCDHCSRLADAETHLRAILRSRCAEQAPPELRARVLGRLSMIRVSGTVTRTVSVSTSSVAGQVVSQAVETRSVGRYRWDL